jgi:hypothetical protein
LLWSHVLLWVVRALILSLVLTRLYTKTQATLFFWSFVFPRHVASITPHFAFKSHVLVFAHYAIDGEQSHTPPHTTQYTALNSKHIEYIDCGACELTSCVHIMNLSILSVIMRFLANLHEWQVTYVVVIVLVLMLAQTWCMSCAVVANAIFHNIFAS